MNPDPYQGALARAADRFASLDGFAAHVRYLRAKDRGLKAEAKAAADAFAAELAAAPLEAAITRLRALDQVRGEVGDPPGLTPYPVALAAAGACLRWEETDPGAAEPLLIRAWLQSDPSLAAEAVARAPGDPRAIRAEIARLLGSVSDALHHIDEGALSGDAEEVRDGLAHIRALCARLGEAAWCAPVLADAARFEALLDGLEVWAAAGRPERFAAFMRSRGVEIGDVPVYSFTG